MRIALGVEYLGTHFHGFQSQSSLRTVQAELEQSISKVAAESVKIVCAGRTDAGVHAIEQVVHFDTVAIRSNRAWLLGANRFLPSDINIIWVTRCADDFHARFHAIARQYHYKIYNSRVRSALKRDTYLWESRHLDVGAMREASTYLIGTHDFSSFRDSQCQAKSPIKTVEYLTISQHNNEIIIDIKANAFLHHMVRNIVGTLLKVGYKDKQALWVKEVLDAQDRKQAGMTASARGLYFTKAFYDTQLP